MIAIAKPSPGPKQGSGWQQGFLAMMPDIVKSAHIAFRNLNPEARQEAVQEVLVSAMLAYVGLTTKGSSHLAMGQSASMAVLRL
jgi:hypothetical protein